MSSLRGLAATGEGAEKPYETLLATVRKYSHVHVAGS